MSFTSTLRETDSRRALSLVELLIVLVILVLLGGLLVPVVSGVKERAEIAATTATIREVQKAILGDGQAPGYLADMGELPRPCYGLPFGTPCNFGVGNAPPSSARVNHPQLRYLYINPASETASPNLDIGQDIQWSPATGRGWRGPYMVSATGKYVVDTGRSFTTRYGDESNPIPNTFPLGPDPTPLDAWGNPIVIQEPQEDPTVQAIPEYLELGTRLLSAGPNGIIETDPGVWNPSIEERGDDILLYLFGPDPVQ